MKSVKPGYRKCCIINEQISSYKCVHMCVCERKSKRDREMYICVSECTCMCTPEPKD